MQAKRLNRLNKELDVFIDLDGEKFKKKKLCPESYLSKIRNQLKLSNDIIFLSKDGYQIDNEDEEQSPLSDCLIQKDKTNKLNLKTNKSNYIVINVYLNNNKIHSCKYFILILFSINFIYYYLFFNLIFFLFFFLFF